MVGKRLTAEPLFYAFRLEDHVPANHPLRAVDALLDTSFICRIMAPCYGAIGRTSIDPKLMVRMLLASEERIGAAALERDDYQPPTVRRRMFEQVLR